MLVKRRKYIRCIASCFFTIPSVVDPALNLKIALSEVPMLWLASLSLDQSFLLYSTLTTTATISVTSPLRRRHDIRPHSQHARMSETSESETPRPSPRPERPTVYSTPSSSLT